MNHSRPFIHQHLRKEPRSRSRCGSSAAIDAITTTPVLRLELCAVAIGLRAVGLARTFREHQEHGWYPLAEQRDSRPLLLERAQGKACSHRDQPCPVETL